MHDARQTSTVGQNTSQAFQAVAKDETGMVAPSVGVIGNLPVIASQADRPWFNSLAGQIVELTPDDIEKIGLKKPDFQDRFVVDHADEIGSIINFGVQENLVKEPLIRNLVDAPMGADLQGEACGKVFSEMLESMKFDISSFQDKVISSLGLSEEQRIVFKNYWSWAESDFNYNLSIYETESLDTERGMLALRIDNQIGGALAGLNISNLTGSLSHLGKAACCFASMIADTGFKGNSISLLEDGCPYFEFAEIVSEISKEDQAAMSAMHDSVGNYDLDKIEKFISENYPDVAAFCEECTGGEWGYPLLECVEAQVDLRGDWRKDYDSKKGVMKNIDEIEKLIKDWKRSSIFNDHPVYDFLKTAISIFRENFNIHAENAVCWAHGSDLILNSKFVGFGADAEELLMNYVNEQSWNEEIESIIITIEKPDLVLPFIRNIALSEIMIIGLAAAFEQA